jgi:hypothetical protein
LQVKFLVYSLYFEHLTNLSSICNTDSTQT